jgi:hypothetical protein
MFGWKKKNMKPKIRVSTSVVTIPLDHSDLETPANPETVVTKTCIRCGKVKLLSEMGRDRGGYHPWCYDCKRLNGREMHKIKKMAPPMPTHCECCGASAKDRPLGKLVLDHDHKTGKFRGWICDKCNIGIGKLGDDVEGIQRAIDYLNRVKDREIKEINLFEVNVND